MTTRLTGWTPGLKTVSLIEAIRNYSGKTLSESKKDVESLIQGIPISVEFPDKHNEIAFRDVATKLGVKLE